MIQMLPQLKQTSTDFFFLHFFLLLGLVVDWISWQANCFPQHLYNLAAQLMGQGRVDRGKDVA